MSLYFCRYIIAQIMNGALVHVSLSKTLKTLNPELLFVAVSTVYECHMTVSRFG